VIRAVIFDIGGVLEANPDTGWRERWSAAAGLEAAEFDRRLNPIFSAGSVGTITLAEVEREIAAALTLDPADLARLMDEIWVEYIGTLNHELARYFAELRPRYRTGILSNSFVGAREREQALYGFEDMCDVVVYSHEEGSRKPEARFYRVVCERLGVPAGECVFLDDLETCRAGARAVGMQAIRFIDTEQAIGELEELLSAPSDESRHGRRSKR
jgi:epoxide hydrolase-like predicted phosphatase